MEVKEFDDVMGLNLLIMHNGPWIMMASRESLHLTPECNDHTQEHLFNQNTSLNHNASGVNMHIFSEIVELGT